MTFPLTDHTYSWETGVKGWVIVIIDPVPKIAVLAAAVTVRNVNGDIRSQRKYASGPGSDVEVYRSTGP